MPIVAPKRYQTKSKPHRRQPYVRLGLLLIIFIGLVNYVRPLPAATAKLNLQIPAGVSQPSLAWPTGGEAAVAASGYGLLGTYGNQLPLATASIAKIITALCVLQKEPLALGQSGPTYTLDASDVAIYNAYVAQDGSVIRVEAGEQLTEYQALQAMLLPSANNIADSLAYKVFGSQAAYAAYATSFLQQHNLNATHIGSDASGFDPSTTSTASDLTQLGILALENPILLQIAGQTTADLPLVGTVHTYNTVLSQNGITGLKTGNNLADPGAFLFTATMRLGGKDIPLTGTILNAPSLGTALTEGASLAGSFEQGFEQTSIASANQTVGNLHTAWGATSPIITKTTIQIVRWKAMPITETHILNAGIRSGTIGSLKISAGQATNQTSLVLARTIRGPSFWWRLTRH